MKQIKGGVLAFTALILIGATHIAAQEEAVERERPAFRRGANVERIMSMRERLELTDEQIASLDEIRRELVQERNSEMAGLAEMRSQLEAGQIRRSEMMAYMEERRDAAQGVTEQRRARVEGVLNEAQLESLEEMGAQARAFARGQARGLRRGQGIRSGRNGDRGGQGIRGLRPDGRRDFRGPPRRGRGGDQG